MEADSVVSNSETELWRFDILKSLDVSFAGDDVAGESVEDAQGCGLFDHAQVGFRPVAPNDLLRHILFVGDVWLDRRSAHALEVLGSKAKFGENLFVRNAFAAGERLLGRLGLASLLFADRLIVIGRAGQSAGEGIEHDLQQTDHGGDLAGSHAVDQFMRVLSVVGRSHDMEFSEIWWATLGVSVWGSPREGLFRHPICFWKCPN